MTGFETRKVISLGYIPVSIQYADVWIVNFHNTLICRTLNPKFPSNLGISHFRPSFSAALIKRKQNENI